MSDDGRGLTAVQGLSRRQLLARAGSLAAAVSAAPLMAACGQVAQRATVGASAWWARQRHTGQLVFANWPLYIDYENYLKDRPSLNQFSRHTGIEVAYEEVIDNNAPFYAKIEPRLRARKPLGYDLMVLTNGWQLTQLIDNGWLIELDHELLPSFSSYAAAWAKNPNYDPGNRYTIPWQSGLTGIAYNTQVIDREITSIKDLWDPAFSGRVGMMSDNTDLGTAGLLSLGVDPARSTSADWRAAAALLQSQRPLVRNYYNQHYIDALQNGDIWIGQAWSGDIFQANASGYPHLRFVVPREGVMHWTDNLMIPVGAANPLSAIQCMDYYYQPGPAARVAAWVEFITPVPAAREMLRSLPANSPLVFPTPAMLAKARSYPTYRTQREYDTWNSLFDPIISG
jgi:spermidine/putrescine transport system substrate-binding protein